MLLNVEYMNITMYEIVYCTKSRQWKWPFVCLRKYGWSDGIFSFEAGTRCLTGEGLYAFATPRAQEIFNKVAERCAPPVQKLNYEDIKLSLEYESNANYVSHTPIKNTICKHIRNPKGRVSESKPNAKMGTSFNSTSTPTDLHRYVNTYLHPTYDNTPMSPLPSIVSSPCIPCTFKFSYADLADLSPSETNSATAALSRSTQYSNVDFDYTRALGIAAVERVQQKEKEIKNQHSKQPTQD